MNSLNLCKLPIVFSKAKLRFGHKFSQFIHKFKIGICWLLVLGSTSKFFPINKEILGFLNVALARLLIFPNSWKRWKIKHFEYKPRLHFQIFPNSLKSWEIGIFEVPLISYFVRLWGLSFRHSMFVDKRVVPTLWLNCQFSRKKKYSYSNNNFVSV